MSYILDALRKADAERARDAAAVPDLYAQTDAGPEGVRRSPPGLKWMLWVFTALALAGLAWVWLGAARVEPAPAEPHPSLAPLAVQPPPPVAPPVDTPAAAPMATVPPAPTKAAVAVPAQLVAPPTPSSLAAPKPRLNASAAGPAPLPTLAELPAELRAQLPALTVGGAVYSAAAAGRLVILNGQVFREGDQPVEGLTIEQIGLKSTQLVFRGLRFEIMH